MPIDTLRTPLRRTTIAQALAAMSEFDIRCAGTELVWVPESEGRILAEMVVAAEDVPAFARSMVDGFAVHADDVRDATSEHPVALELAGEIAMGASALHPLGRGQAIAVPTGGMLPGGCTGVVKIEDTRLEHRSVMVLDGSDADQRITPKASDVGLGDLLFAKGTVLSPAAVGLLAAAGVVQVSVYQEPAVGVLVTGDELVAPGRPLRVGQIRESNGAALCAALEALGFSPRRYERVPDDRDVIAAALKQALDECDALIISGGSSVGAKDYTPSLVAEAGSPGVIVHGVRVKPGRPVMLGIVGDRPVIGLPGNPVSALVMFETLAKPILLRMFEKTDASLPMRACLEETLELDPVLEYRIPLQLERDVDGLRAKTLLGASSQMHILGFADAFMIVPEGQGRMNAGTWIDAWPFTRSRSLR